VIIKLDSFAYRVGAFTNLIFCLVWDAIAPYFVNLFLDNIVDKIQWTNLSMGAWIVFKDDSILPPDKKAQLVLSGYIYMLAPFIWIYGSVIHGHIR
jgi:hypothetical protein